jgi:chloride channel 7
MTILSYGTFVPSGLFLPGILIGCSLGRMMTLFLSTYLNHEASPATYGTIGAAAVLCGYTRLSFSLAIIMLETTENINLFLPIIFALFISFAVGRMFTNSYYAIQCESKSLPLLNETVPKQNENLVAEQIMSKDVVTLNEKASVRQILDVLKMNN